MYSIYKECLTVDTQGMNNNTTDLAATISKAVAEDLEKGPVHPSLHL